MSSTHSPKKSSEREPAFRIEGRVRLEGADGPAGDFKLRAFAFDPAGRLLGQDDVDAQGGFSLAADLRQPADFELVITPEGEAETARRSAAYSRKFTAKDWAGEGSRFSLKTDLAIARHVWQIWWPLRICVSGHVRKVHTENGHTEVCPVPFVKVEIFDVDREGCWWPYFDRLRERLFDRRVVRLPDLLKERIPLPFPPEPIPGPDPAPFERLPRLGFQTPAAANLAALNPQPLPPKALEAAFLRQPPAGRVGEIAGLEPAAAEHLEQLTLTSRLAPWAVFPHCFYSRALVCETTTDCDGYFRCCFTWWPFHFRNGRLRFDLRPDIIIRVTQIINGVPTVIYLDPYTSTRWNITHAHIDLYLDDEDVQCGHGCVPQPEGTATFFTLVGLDEVYKINQGTGKFSNLAYGGALNNWAYGGNLLIAGVFGAALTTGAPKRYYRLSYRKGGDPFKPIRTALGDTRVNKVSFVSESVTLGPQIVNGVPDLYEIRNTADYYWYNLDKLGWWNTEAVELDEGLYTLRLEVFNELGVKLTSADVDYRDGTVAPPGPLPAMLDRCDLQLLVDNRPPDLALNVPKAGGPCGVVKWADVPGLTIDITATQDNGRLYSWVLTYVKGLSGGSGVLGSAANGAGLGPLPINLAVSAAPMTAGLTSTCAFALTLGAWPLVRDGFSAIHHASLTKAIAIEKCS
ncbi:MAG: hypothetical protein JNK29_08625 [Anaerolineales bacterium]|nr:hypothetical protein [Anaerolineales bacterium]